MPLSAQQIKEKLQSAIDQDANVVDMGHVLEAIHVLEKTFIPKESLEETRLGKLVNDIRKKSADRELTNRCRKLVRQWQKQHLKNSNGSSNNSPQANQRTPSSSAVAVGAATSKPTSSDASVQGGAPSQASVDKTNPANRKKRKTELSSPREGQPSAKLVKSTKIHDSNGIPRDSNRKVVKSSLTNEVKNRQIGSKLSKPGQSNLSPSVCNLSPSVSKRTSPNVTSLENAKKLPRVKSSNSLGSLEGSKSSKSSPCLLKPENKSSPALSRLKASPRGSPKGSPKSSSSSPRVANILKDGKRNNTVSPALVTESHSRKKNKKSTPPAPSIFEEESKVKTKSIFDEDDSGLKSASIFDDDDDDDDNVDVVESIINDKVTHSLFDDDEEDVEIDATIYMKNNQDCLDKNRFLSSKEHVEDVVSCSQTVSNTDDSTVLRTSPSVESNVDTSLSSKIENEDVFKKIDIFEEPVRIVTEGEIDRIHDTQWSGVNGCYDSAQEWHSWSDGYSVPHNNPDNTALHILPYVCLD